MKTIFSTLLFFLLLHSADAKPAIQKLWTNSSGFSVPESVYFDKDRQKIYVSNINGKPIDKDGNGFISLLSRDGKLIKLKWITGLHAPKGMGVWKNSLYVTDISRVVEIDLPTGKIKKIMEVGGKFLNDIAINNQGALYVSDMMQDCIYKFENGQGRIWLHGLNKPNGLFWYDNSLYIAGSGDGKFWVIKNNQKKKIELANLGAGLDGLERVPGQGWLLSKWAGAIYFINANYEPILLLDRRHTKINSADIGYDPDRKILYIPTFFQNSIEAWQLLYR